MRVRRTGGKRGQRVTWYIWADQPDEQAAIRAGLLPERSPDARWRFVLAWGFPSREAAEGAMERVQIELDAALGQQASLELADRARVVLARIFRDWARLDTHRAELRAFGVRLRELGEEHDDRRLAVLANALDVWSDDDRARAMEMLQTVQMACLLCGVKEDETKTDRDHADGWDVGRPGDDVCG